MTDFLSCCGVNCEMCDIRIATVNNDEKQRNSLMKRWRDEFIGIETSVGMISCTGCNKSGVKLEHCEKCKIRNCVRSKGYINCGDCAEIFVCQVFEGINTFASHLINKPKKYKINIKTLFFHPKIKR